MPSSTLHLSIIDVFAHLAANNFNSDIRIFYSIYQYLKWCPGPDLNRHDLNGREILSLLCLPISPPGQAWSAEGREGYHARRLTEAP